MPYSEKKWIRRDGTEVDVLLASLMLDDAGCGFALNTDIMGYGNV